MAEKVDKIVYDELLEKYERVIRENERLKQAYNQPYVPDIPRPISPWYYDPNKKTMFRPEATEGVWTTWGKKDK